MECEVVGLERLFCEWRLVIESEWRRMKGSVPLNLMGVAVVRRGITGARSGRCLIFVQNMLSVEREMW